MRNDNIYINNSNYDWIRKGVKRMIYVLCISFFIIGFILGIKAAEMIMNKSINNGKMFFKNKDGTWHGNWDIITKELNAAILKNNPHGHI